RIDTGIHIGARPFAVGIATVMVDNTRGAVAAGPGLHDRAHPARLSRYATSAGRIAAMQGRGAAGRIAARRRSARPARTAATAPVFGDRFAAIDRSVESGAAVAGDAL